MKRLSFLASLAMLMFAVGCETDEMAANNSQIELNLKGTISSLQKSTRVNSSGFEAEDMVGVYVSNRGSLLTSGNMVDNAAFIYNDGALAAESGEKVYWGSESVRLNVYAYYPYAASVADNTAYPFSVAANQSTEAAFYNSDFLTASALDLAPQTTPVELAFDHSLSRVNIALTAGTDITQEELSSAAKTFTLDGYILGGKINLSNGEAEVSTTSASTITPLAVDGTSYSAIVYPQSGTLTFTLNLNGEIYTYSAEYDYEAGYQYQYTLKINARKPIEMILESTSINPWEDGEPTEGEMSDIITFTDAAFKEFLLNEVDTNHDNEISIAEASLVTDIYIDSGISTLDDLQHFNNLEALDIVADIEQIVLPPLNSLKVLYIQSETLVKLDIHNCPNIEDLGFCGIPFEGFDLENYKQLRELHISSTSLHTLSISNNATLEKISIANNSQLKQLNIANCPSLTNIWTQQNMFDKLDFSAVSSLESIYLNQELNLKELNISKNSELVGLNIALSCYLETLDVSQNTFLELLSLCGGVHELDVSNNLALKSLNYTVSSVNGDYGTLYMAEGQEIAEMELGENIEIQYK